jgi:hypothetical protein
MRYWTWAEIKAKIESETDIQDEVFIEPSELLAYANEAIDEAEAEIHGLSEDYFLDYVDIPVTAGDEFLSIPANLPKIYANKIREIIFTMSGGTNYTVTRIKDWKKFKEKALLDQALSTDLYQYFPVNRSAGTPEIMFVPKIRESGSVRIWYLRNANRLVNDTDICDIPEFINFIFAHMRMKIYGKEGHPSYPQALERLEVERQRMLSTLQNMVPDSENEIEMDTSSYEDMN